MRTEKNVLVVVMFMAGIEPPTANEYVSSVINSLLEVCPEAVLFEDAINLSGIDINIPITQHLSCPIFAC